MADEQEDLSSRRRVLGWGARLALGVPAVLAGLQLAGATAHADDDDDDGGRGRGRGRSRGLGIGLREIEVEENEEEVQQNNVTFSANLVPVNQVNTNDFNPGGSDTGSGTLSVISNGTAGNASISVRLRGATANATYTVIFEVVGGSRTGGLGSFTTNAAGNANAFFSGALPESGSGTSNGLGTRVGVFVLTRSGAGDAFVTAA